MEHRAAEQSLRGLLPNFQGLRRYALAPPSPLHDALDNALLTNTATRGDPVCRPNRIAIFGILEHASLLQRISHSKSLNTRTHKLRRSVSMLDTEHSAFESISPPNGL